MEFWNLMKAAKHAK